VRTISIIIPVLNEAPRLEVLLPALFERTESTHVCEVVVADGGSSDGSREVAHRHGARICRSQKGRAVQMNAGALEAQGEILYFLHADSFPPHGFDRHIIQAMEQRQRAGCFRLRFEPSHWFLNFFAWWTRVNIPICRGGDQSLFIPRKWFEELGGFDEQFRIYEDNEFIGRIYQKYPFYILPEEIITSSRRYKDVGMYSLQYHFTVIHLKRWLGAGPDSLYRYYKEHIQNGKTPGTNTAGNNP
jgi:rSAM/selenodomain-associated transferase 2